MGRKKGKNTAVITVSILASQKKMIDDIVDLDDPDLPGPSRIVQLALREWLSAHTEQYIVEEGGISTAKTRLKKAEQPSEKRASAGKESFAEAMKEDSFFYNF